MIQCHSLVCWSFHLDNFNKFLSTSPTAFQLYVGHKRTVSLRFCQYDDASGQFYFFTECSVKWSLVLALKFFPSLLIFQMWSQGRSSLMLLVSCNLFSLWRTKDTRSKWVKQFLLICWTAHLLPPKHLRCSFLLRGSSSMMCVWGITVTFMTSFPTVTRTSEYVIAGAWGLLNWLFLHIYLISPCSMIHINISRKCFWIIVDFFYYSIIFAVDQRMIVSHSCFELNSVSSTCEPSPPWIEQHDNLTFKWVLLQMSTMQEGKSSTLLKWRANAIVLEKEIMNLPNVVKRNRARLTFSGFNNIKCLYSQITQ